MCTKKESYLIDNYGKNSTKAGRKKIWQLDSSFHCSIIGTCLTLIELRDLYRKTRMNEQISLSNYELHRSFVGVAGAPTYAARRLHKYLDHKYRTTIRRFDKVKLETELQALWGQAVKSSDVAATYWAVVTHPWASEALCHRVYGEVHMLSHLAGATIRVDSQELSQLRVLKKTLAQQLADIESKAKEQIKERDQKIAQQRERLTLTQTTLSELDKLRRFVATLEQEPLSLKLRKQVEEYAAKLANARLRAERAEAMVESLKQGSIENHDRQQTMEQQLAHLLAERDALEAALEKLLSPDCSACEDRTECSTGVNLCGRCILYVGGRSRQCANFRVLVERQNGRFIHHDGGLNDGPLRLKSILPQADVVLCPLDCVSHDAVNRVKQYCKRHRKHLVFLPQSSLAAFTRGLNELTI